MKCQSEGPQAWGLPADAWHVIWQPDFQPRDEAAGYFRP